MSTWDAPANPTRRGQWSHAGSRPGGKRGKNGRPAPHSGTPAGGDTPSEDTPSEDTTGGDATGTEDTATAGTTPVDPGPPTARGADGKRRRLGDLLIAAGVLDQEQLDRALTERAMVGDRRERLGAAIVRLGLASAEEIGQALATQLGLEFVPDERVLTDAGATRVLPAAIAERHHVLGLALREDGTLILAIADPADVVAVDDVRLATRAKRVEIVVATERAIGAGLKIAYGVGKRTGDLLDNLEVEEEEDDDAAALADRTAVEQAPIVKLAEGILSEALRAGASDVHVEPMERGTVVRFRIDGVLHQAMRVPKSASGALMSRLKLMSNMDIAERRRPQDGRARLRGGRGDVDLRASTLPSLHGETMVMRLLRKGGDRLTMDDLGFSEQQESRCRAAIGRPQGLVLITGPTGSGKTSTLYAFLADLARETHNIITLEDPIEYELDGVNQTQVNGGIGLTFARAMRTVLRQDPDVVMLGEIRDPEAAEIAIQASLTGHMVFSTLHTNDAAGAVVRLRDLDVPGYLISSSLSMVMAQRLARRICTACAEPVRPSDEHVALLRLSTRDVESGHWRRGAGCSRCSGSGYRGRVGLYEVIDVADRVREALTAGGNESVIRQAARRSGVGSLREDGLAKARAGLTTLDELLRVTPADLVEQGVCPTCQVDVEPEFAFCPWCTTDLRGRRCDTCERELHLGWVACPACGTVADGEDSED